MELSVWWVFHGTRDGEEDWESLVNAADRVFAESAAGPGAARRLVDSRRHRTARKLAATVHTALCGSDKAISLVSAVPRRARLMASWAEFERLADLLSPIFPAVE